jgi:hypothetical protein
MVDDCESLLESIPDIEGLFEQKTKDEIQAILDDFLSSDTSSESSSRETRKYGNVDAAVKELMG